MQDDRVDATTRGFLGLTVACATCHDHKFDPIPTKDFYSLQGVFSNTKLHELPLAPKDVVDAWETRKKAARQAGKRSRQVSTSRSANRSPRFSLRRRRKYLLAAREAGSGRRARRRNSEAMEEVSWRKTRSTIRSSIPSGGSRESSREFQRTRHRRQRREESRSMSRTRSRSASIPTASKIAGASLESLERSKYMLWRDMFAKSTKDAAGFFKTDDGVYYYSKGTVERFLQGDYSAYLEHRRRSSHG